MEVKRELLERALDALDCPGCSIGHRCGKCDNDVDNNGVVRDAIIAALSAPERKPMTLAEIKSNPVISYFGVESGEKIVRAVEAFHDIKEAP